GRGCHAAALAQVGGMPVPPGREDDLVRRAPARAQEPREERLADLPAPENRDPALGCSHEGILRAGELPDCRRDLLESRLVELSRRCQRGRLQRDAAVVAALGQPAQKTLQIELPLTRQEVRAPTLLAQAAVAVPQGDV